MKFYYIEWSDGSRTETVYSNKQTAISDMRDTGWNGTVKSLNVLPKPEEHLVWVKNKHLQKEGFVYHKRSYDVVMSSNERLRMVHRIGKLQRRR